MTQFIEYTIEPFGKPPESTPQRFFTIGERVILTDENGEKIGIKETFLSIVDMSKISLVSITDFHQKRNDQYAQINGVLLINGQLNLLPINRYSLVDETIFDNRFFIEGEQVDFFAMYEYLTTLIS